MKHEQTKQAGSKKAQGSGAKVKVSPQLRGQRAAPVGTGTPTAGRAEGAGTRPQAGRGRAAGAGTSPQTGRGISDEEIERLLAAAKTGDADTGGKAPAPARRDSRVGNRSGRKTEVKKTASKPAPARGALGKRLQAEFERQSAGKPNRTLAGREAARAVAPPSDKSKHWPSDTRHKDADRVESLVRQPVTKHAPGALPINTQVWHRGIRMFVEWAPKDWSKSTSVRVSSRMLRLADGEEPIYQPVTMIMINKDMTTNRVSYFVHADELEMAAPITIKTMLRGHAPTKHREEQRKSGQQDVGDDVAKLLRESKDIYATASKFLGIGVPDLKTKYGHLNPGQQRMNLGNRMRAYQRKTK